jgi:RecJ-like exonuclease
MNWDWQKALQIVNTSSVATAGVGGAAAKRKSGDAGAGMRPSSIVWRTTGMASARLAGASDVQLLMEKEYDCPFCRGRGDLTNGGVCPVCSGGKQVHVAPPAVKCAFCGGQGQMPPRSNMSCWVCKGKGLVAVHGPVQICPDCQGRGKRPCESLYCPRCRGVGAIARVDRLY